MYCPDTMKRLNDEAVAQYQERVAEDQEQCEYCDNPAVEVLSIYNPADEMRVPPVDGVYSTLCRCEECRDQSIGEDGIFQCPDCSRWFVVNHSWDVLAVMTDDGYKCQKCAVAAMEGMYLWVLLRELRNGKVANFTRVNSVPNREKFFEGEYSSYSDFPGFTNTDALANAIEHAAVKAGVGTSDVVFPIVDHSYQFSVSLAVYW